MSIELEFVVLLVEVDVMVLTPPFLVLIFSFLIMLLRSISFILVESGIFVEGAGGYLDDMSGNAN